MTVSALHRKAFSSTVCLTPGKSRYRTCGFSPIPSRRAPSTHGRSQLPGEFDNTYTYFQTWSNGESGLSDGTVDGNVWTWTDDSTVKRGRFNEKVVNADVAAYTYEMAHGSESLTLVTEGKQT